MAELESFFLFKWPVLEPVGLLEDPPVVALLLDTKGYVEEVECLLCPGLAPGQISLVHSHIQTLEAPSGLLNKVTDILNRFASILNAQNKGVPSAGKSTASLTEGEKNTNPVT
nr:hypothetical protein [Tanacetum cinerariifolium]